MEHGVQSTNPGTDPIAASGEAASSSKLSYKFQRLREKLRAAIDSGELAGKLPGERQLAKQFNVNAKTLSKALTDLAAEGLLDRSIGRGTFVKGSAAAEPGTTASDRWMILCDEDQVSSGVIEHLKQFHENIQVVSDPSSLRPSFLNSIKAVIDLASNTPDAFLRNLVVRNINVVLVGREPTTYSVHAVLVDRPLAASCLARDMMLNGHSRFLAVERRGQTSVVEAIRRSAQRYAPHATVDSVWPADVAGAVEQSGATAIICDTRKSAVQVRSALTRRGISIPAQVSLAAIGSGWGDYPCSGYFLHSRQKADTVVQLLRDTNLKRPATIWMTGVYHDGGTLAAPQGVAIGAQNQEQRVEQAQPDLRYPASVRL